MLLWYSRQVFWATSTSHCYGDNIRYDMVLDCGTAFSVLLTHTIRPRWVILEAAASLWVEQFWCAVLICFYGIVGKCFEPLEAPHCYGDNIWYDMVLDCGTAFSVLLTVRPRWVILEAAASLWVEQFWCAVLICFYGMVGKCFEPLEAPHCYGDNIRYDIVPDARAGRFNIFNLFSTFIGQLLQLGNPLPLHIYSTEQYPCSRPWLLQAKSSRASPIISH